MQCSPASRGVAALLCLWLVSATSAFRIGGCQFNVNGGLLPSPEPLFLQPNGSLDVNGYLQPDGAGNVELATGDKVVVACPGKKLSALGVEEAVLSCVAGSSFSAAGSAGSAGLWGLQDLACSAHPAHAAVKTGDACGDGGRGDVARIGHATSRGLVALVEVCFLAKSLEALWASAVVSGSIGGAETGVARPSFVAGSGFYGSVDPNSHYVRGGQQSAFAKLLGSEELSLRYISNSSDYYLARGHLSAKADFVWAQPQRATHYYVNAAPQWQTFNGGNWERLESSVRALAKARRRDLKVVTGTWGRARLPDATGVPTDLFINADGLIPVPALYWKVVVDEATGEGAAFVGVNNPYTTLASEPRLRLCADVCGQLSWVNWAPTSVKAGEGYCCEVAALRAALPDLPDLKVGKLLTSV